MLCTAVQSKTLTALLYKNACADMYQGENPIAPPRGAAASRRAKRARLVGTQRHLHVKTALPAPFLASCEQRQQTIQIESFQQLPFTTKNVVKMASGNQQQTQMRAASFFAGAAMPWACSSSSSTSSSSGLQQQQQQQRARLAPATMTFGLPALLQQGGGARRRGGAPPPPFASVGAAAASATGGVPKLFATKKTEEHTGIAFPDTLCVVGKHDCPGLAGVG